ncbi:MAG: septation protein SepH [Mobiluncus porci]|uniref:septation protein SepH n=1 Tax=Mobiluncus TaxID=2050 RepID=UPI0023F2EC82|nr:MULTISPECIES: septation protein SepH [Mobiluncus]MCI6585336.1 septation protein SepH [Mobiluncus sp.]MDD7541455.1 septation protein SepH [Mobiluncus porci]MDY5748440.1 septation protein SepH [Mobiluncus porci]
MKDLSLLGIHTDSEHLVLVDEEGERYLLPINEELRSIVRQHRRKIAAALENAPAGSIRPKEIQSMIRGGATAEEVATAAGIELEHVKRYEAPVLSERAWAAQQARQTRVAPDPDAPDLGDLVIDRLATRGVAPESLRWDATRQPGEEWMIHLEFVQDAKTFEANWEFDMDNRVISALDEQSRWLTETAAPSGSASLIRQSIFGRDAETAADPRGGERSTSGAGGASAGVSAGVGIPVDSPALSETEALLNELNAARGTRLTVVSGNDDDDVAAMEAAIASGFQEPPEDGFAQSRSYTADIPIGAAGGSAAGVGSSSSERDNVTAFRSRGTTQGTTGDALPEAERPVPDDASEGVLPGMEAIIPETPPAPEPPRRSRQSGRAPMPSWDEILFGSKSE